jgi:nicotinamidase-related amidase
LIISLDILPVFYGGDMMNDPKIHGLLTPDNCTLLLIDHEPQMAFAVKNIDVQALVNNVTGLAKAAKIFKVPTVITTVAADTFSGPVFEGIKGVFPNLKPIDRESINAWDDRNFVAAVKKAGRNKLIFGGLWTELCVGMPAISAMEEGYEAYIVADACGDISDLAQDMAMWRMVQAGAVPMTWMQVLLELQRSWGNKKTYDAVLRVAEEHGGTYGQGIQYARRFVWGQQEATTSMR